MNKLYLVIGASGRLGRSLMSLLGEQALGVGMSNTSPTLDITDWQAVRRLLEEVRPQVVIHAAAWTDVDGCARDPQRARLINGIGTQHVAAASARVGAELVYISTNEVFDGQAQQPYGEYAPCAPINPYGYSKWLGEQGVRAVQPRHYIVRTAWLFAHGGKNFIQAILGAAQAGKPLRVVIDEIANPTYNDDLAAAILRLIPTGRYGTFHLVNEGAVSRYGFARYVLDQVGHNQTPITPISRQEWPRPSTPPPYAALENAAAASLGVTLRPWQQAVNAFLHAEGLLRDEETA
ncbi:MAG: dTDP-4-dehydrorhamnose reductase [Anaerolineae bacterium]|nr:dTDP-4-dehydrorhamnose reductase [Anaerolineae bacterium]MDW8173660.1 dTDP-4-dehydrorhamnose reductase [Anaerolineae bacterium]